MLESFEEYRDNRHQEAIAWKEETGGKVVGVYCCDVPEELIHAAGMLPVRIMGEHEDSTEADLHFPVNVCPYVKQSFDIALRGQYDYLDGLVVPNTCDIIRAMYGFWKLNTDIPYVRFLEVPQKLSQDGLEFFAEELGRFKESLEEFGGRPITNEALTESISIHNENRNLLMKAQAMKRQESPLLSGSAVHKVVLASTVMPKERHNQLLSQLLSDVEANGESEPAGARLLLSASMLDDSDFIEVIEECGGSVVADDMPMGSRYFNSAVDETADPLAALAERYLMRIACPRKMNAEQRLSFLLDQMEGADVQGVIIHNLRACDCHLYEYPYLRQHLEEAGLPVLFFKGEETETELEQQRDEIEAFIEMLE
jgi:benzoyl-CoA reductase subunit C